jgi:hypothetical protein
MHIDNNTTTDTTIIRSIQTGLCDDIEMARTPGGLAGSILISITVFVSLISIIVLHGMARSSGGALSFSGVQTSLMQQLIPLVSPLDPHWPLPSAYNGSVDMKATRRKVDNSSSGPCTVGIATLVKNENHVVAEWIEHYLAEVSA